MYSCPDAAVRSPAGDSHEVNLDAAFGGDVVQINGTGEVV